MLSPTRWLLVLTMTSLIVGCGSTIIVASAPVDAGPAVDTALGPDAPAPVDRPAPVVDDGPRPPPRDAGVTPVPACVLADGTVCPLGQTCASADRCTVCQCTPRGLQCASRPCDPPPSTDGGITPPLDGGPASCVIRGVTCRVNETCLIDRCTQCRCGPTGDVACRVDPACGVDGGTIGVDVPSVGVDATARGCLPQDALGEGFCDLLLGVYWQGARCVAVGGCRCVGVDCPRPFASFAECEMAHVICPR